MYIIFSCILLLLILCSILMAWRRKKIIRKICCLPVKEKLCRLNELIQPFGFEYLLSQDIFTSRFDAWQRDFGYCWLYDRHAAAFNMVLECESIYFDYKDCTYMIELWKGQYGINTGAEIGIYKANSLIPRNQRKSTLFHSVSDEDLPCFEITLYHGTSPLCRIAAKHWWLTGFRMGQYADPEDLILKAAVTFPAFEMQLAFVKGLISCGYMPEEIAVDGRQVSFGFSSPHTVQPEGFCPIRSAYSQWKNRIFLRIYCHVTKPFCLTVDKLLYLYEYLPFAFRRMTRIRVPRKTRSFRKMNSTAHIRHKHIRHKREERRSRYVR